MSTPLKRQVRALVIDEHDGHYRTLKEFSEVMEGEIRYESAFAKSTTEAAGLIKKFEPSVIIINAYMKKNSGMTILEHCAYGAVPIVVLSDFHSEELRERVIDKGASALAKRSANPEEMEQFFYLMADLSEQARRMH